MNFKGMFGIYEKPDAQKVYTVQETADLLEASCDEVRKYIVYRNIPHKVIRTKESRAIILDYDAVRLIKEYHEAKLKKREETKRNELLKTQREETVVTEQAEDHPLVTDKRCLKLSWWPDIIPDCFKELGV